MICSSEKRLFLISISCETELRSDRGHPKGQGHASSACLIRDHQNRVRANLPRRITPKPRGDQDEVLQSSVRGSSRAISSTRSPSFTSGSRCSTVSPPSARPSRSAWHESVRGKGRLALQPNSATAPLRHRRSFFRLPQDESDLLLAETRLLHGKSSARPRTDKLEFSSFNRSSFPEAGQAPGRRASHPRRGAQPLHRHRHARHAARGMSLSGERGGSSFTRVAQQSRC